ELGFGGLAGPWRCCGRRGGRGRSGQGRDLVNPDRVLDVLQLAEPDVLDRQIELAPHLLVDGLGETDATRVGQGLEPRGDVHAVPVDLVVLDDHIAEVDPYASVHALVRRARGVAPALLLLDSP